METIMSTALHHDFHNFWGTVLGTTELRHRSIANSMMKQYWEDPAGAIRNFNNIISQYTDRFERFFGGTLPISFHGHVTDAMSPVTAMGMLMRLVIFSRCDAPESIHAPSPLERSALSSMLGFTECHLENPRWAILEGAYAAGFGSLANLSAHLPFRDHATGNLGIQVPYITCQSQTALSSFLSSAKEHGCIGVIVEIVSNQRNGRVIDPSELQNLASSCEANGLLLAIDETITALRCGAPFAHQRPEYTKGPGGKPDLVFFGKALGAQGIAVNFDGPFMRRLGIDAPARRLQAVRDWQAVVTKALQLPVLIDALGVLEMAVAGDWVGRARVIGENLRRLVLERAQEMKRDSRGQEEEDGEDDLETVGGLASFLFVNKKVATTFLVMGALSAGGGTEVHWVRWLPRMDHYLTDRSAVEHIISRQSTEKRREMAERLGKEGERPQWCFCCGTWARGTKYPWCRTCCIDSCDAEECLQYLFNHSCVA